LGLQEIGSLRATVDYRETGKFNPQAVCVEALRPDSVHIPIARANGITAALVAPSGGLISGQSGLIRLTGWTPQEMVIKSPVAMHIDLPTIGRPRFQRATQTQQEQASKQLKEIRELFKEVRIYQKQKNAAEKNALLPSPFFDVMEGWKVAEEIKKSGIPVVFGSMYDMPPRWEDGYDSIFRNPGVLNQAGVKIAFSSSSASLAKDLPYQAAKAAAFGLDKREALKAVTIYPAQIFGVDDQMGSLEKGKLANIVVADGDILELGTHIKHVFIEGAEADLTTLYEELLEKYKKRN